MQKHNAMLTPLIMYTRTKTSTAKPRRKLGAVLIHTQNRPNMNTGSRHGMGC